MKTRRDAVYSVGERVVVLTPDVDLVDEGCADGSMDDDWNFLDRAEKEKKLDILCAGTIVEIKRGERSELSEEVLNAFAPEYSGKMVEFEWILLNYPDRSNGGWGWLRLGHDGAPSPFHESDLKSDTEGTPRILEHAME